MCNAMTCHATQCNVIYDIFCNASYAKQCSVYMYIHVRACVCVNINLRGHIYIYLYAMAVTTHE